MRRHGALQAVGAEIKKCQVSTLTEPLRDCTSDIVLCKVDRPEAAGPVVPVAWQQPAVQVGPGRPENLQRRDGEHLGRQRADEGVELRLLILPRGRGGVGEQEHGEVPAAGELGRDPVGEAVAGDVEDAERGEAAERGRDGALEDVAGEVEDTEGAALG